MAFMQRFIYGPMYGWQVETTHGTELIPEDVVSCVGFPGPDYDADKVSPEVWEEVCDLLRDYCEGEIQSATVVNGYFGRYSAPGYMDCTEWNFDTDPKALAAYLDEMYGDDDESDDDDESEELRP
jgi:hypothetical protein